MGIAKACRKCGVAKPLEEFTLQRSATVTKPRKHSDGHSRICKKCKKEQTKLRLVVAELLEAKCGKCKSVKPALDFWKDNSKTRGLSSQCKECTKARIRDRKQNDELRKRDCRIFGVAQRVRRLRAIEMYGGACECCGEANVNFLSFDHINNDGYKRRHVNTAAHVFSNGYDPMLRLLCYNCNCGRQFAGGPDKICPHEIERNQCLRLVG